MSFIPRAPDQPKNKLPLFLHPQVKPFFTKFKGIKKSTCKYGPPDIFDPKTSTYHCKTGYHQQYYEKTGRMCCQPGPGPKSKLKIKKEPYHANVNQTFCKFPLPCKQHGEDMIQFQNKNMTQKCCKHKQGYRNPIRKYKGKAYVKLIYKVKAYGSMKQVYKGPQGGMIFFYQNKPTSVGSRK